MISNKNYHNSFATLLSFSLLALGLSYSLSSIAQTPVDNTTTVYKVIKADGSVSYSDQPQEQAQKLEVKPITTIPAYNRPTSTATQESTVEASGTYYSELLITKPANNSAFHSGSGDIDVGVTVSPALKTGDLLRFILNGQVVATQDSTQLQLRTLDRGTHTLSVQLINANQQTLRESSSTFTLHRPMIRRIAP